MIAERAMSIVGCALALCLAQGCGGEREGAAGPGAEEIARVGDHGVTRGQFESWLESTLGGPEEAAQAAPDLKSRLLDQYLDEELLVAAARAEGLAVTREETEKLAASGGRTGGNPDAIERALLQRKFKEQVILKGVAVAPDEVRAYFDQHVEEYRRPARVVLRQILVDTESDAKRIHDELAAHRERFEEIAETRSLAPDGGKATALEEAVLPDAIRAALEPLKEGEMSGVVKDPQGFFILVLEGRQPEQAPSFEEARESIELKLLQERSQSKYREYVAGLRERIQVRLNESTLGFAYTRRNGT